MNELMHRSEIDGTLELCFYFLANQRAYTKGEIVMLYGRMELTSITQYNSVSQVWQPNPIRMKWKNKRQEESSSNKKANCAQMT